MVDFRRWGVSLLAAALVAAVAVLTIAEFMPAADADTRREPKPAARIIDGPDGVPVVDYGGDVGVQENPVTVAQWALLFDGDSVTAADWLLERQQADGSWRYHFPHSISGGRYTMTPGWASAMAQGHALSVLTEAHEATGDDMYREAAGDAFSFLMLPVEQGGVRTTLDGDLWFEEYPSDPPSYVLNGFMFTLQGLDDAAGVVDGAAAAFDAGMSTLERHVGRWDVNGRVAYDLMHETAGGSAWYLAYYDHIHRDLLDDLTERHPSAGLEEWRERWFGQT